VRSEDIRAVALVYNVWVPDPEKRKTDAIQATLEHADVYCADVFYPYKIVQGGAVEYQSAFAQEGEMSIFPNAGS